MSAGLGQPRQTAKRPCLEHGSTMHHVIRVIHMIHVMQLPGTRPRELNAGAQTGLCASRQVESVTEAQRWKQPEGPEMNRYAKHVLCIP